MKFSVRYIEARGRVKATVIEADSPAACERHIVAAGGTIVSLHGFDKDSSYGDNRGSVKDLAEFTSVMAALLESSLGVRDALTIIGTIAERKGVKVVASRLNNRLDTGMEFSAAIAAEGGALPPIYLSLVKIGERTGNLSQSFSRLSEYMDDRRKVREALLGALMYPAMVLSLLVVGIIAISVYAIPKLTLVFAGLGGAASESVGESMHRAATVFGAIAWGVGIIAAIIIGIIIARRRGGPTGLRIDSASLAVPVLGSYIADTQTLDFAFAMEALARAGIPLDESLGEAATTATNAAFAACVFRARENVRKGKSLADAFLSEIAMPRHVVQWLAVGERTGRTAEIFSNIRSYYQRSVARWSTRFIGLVEPAVSILVGGIIVLVVMLFVLPLFTAYGSVL